MNIKRIIREEMEDFDWAKEAKPTFGFFIDQFFLVGGYRAFMEAIKDYFGIGETVLLTGDLYLAGGTENSVIKLNQEPFRIMDVNQGKIRVKPIKLSKEHSDMWDSWIGEPYIELGDAKEDGEIIIERPDNPILEQDDFDWIKDVTIYDVLDEHFNLTKGDRGFKINGLDHRPDDDKELANLRVILPWTWEDNKILNRVAFKPAKKVNEIKETSANELYKIIYKKSVWDRNFFKNRKIAKSLKEWKIDRVRGIFREYPKAWECYFSVYERS